MPQLSCTRRLWTQIVAYSLCTWTLCIHIFYIDLQTNRTVSFFCKPYRVNFSGLQVHPIRWCRLVCISNMNFIIVYSQSLSQFHLASQLSYWYAGSQIASLKLYLHTNLEELKHKTECSVQMHPSIGLIHFQGTHWSDSEHNCFAMRLFQFSMCQDFDLKSCKGYEFQTNWDYLYVMWNPAPVKCCPIWPHRMSSKWRNGRSFRPSW
jgi:hypothetical protein